MKMGMESNPSSNPGVSFIEKDSNTKPGRFPAHGEKVHHFNLPKDPQAISRAEYSDYLRVSMEDVLNNSVLIDKAVAAVIAYSESKSVIGLSDIQNQLSGKLINLTDQDIDSIIAKFSKKVIEKFSNPELRNRISVKKLDDVLGGKWNTGDSGNWGFGSSGIKSVIHFLRERTKLLTSEPFQEFEIGYNNSLDSKYSIDIVEAIFSPDQTDLEINLIQIKSSDPSEEEIAIIQKNHIDYIRNIMSMQEIEEIEIPTEKHIFEETLSNQALMIERIFEICTNYESMDNQTLSKTLGLDELNLVQRAWILDTYFEIIAEQIENAFTEGFIEEKNKVDLLRDIRSLRDSWVNKSGIPKRLIRINTVNSIISVDRKILTQKNIYTAGSNTTGLAASI